MLHMARVVEIHPESNAVDVEMMADNRRIPAAPVLSGSAGSDFGLADLTVPEFQGYGKGNSEIRDVYAVIGFIDNHPVVLGFMFPQIAQCLFEEKGLRIARHGSDVYTTVDASGNVELCHPSGTYLRIGVTPARRNLVQKNYDKNWKVKHNTDKAVHVHLSVASRGQEVASLNIDPAGNISVRNNGSTALHSTGDISIRSDTHIGLSAPRIDLN